MNDDADAWLAVVATIAILLCLGAALIVWRVSPKRRVNQRLAIVLVAEATVFVGGLLMSSFDGRVGNIGYFVFIFTILALPWLYLRFLAWGLDSPWTRPLRGTWPDRATWIVPLAAMMGAWALLASNGFPDTDGAPWPAWPLAAALFVVPVFAIVASIDALRRAPAGTAARARARAFLAAFALRDTTFLLMILGMVGTHLLFGNWEYMDARHIPHAAPPAWAVAFDQVSVPIFVAGLVAYVPLLAYGVLKTQLFDIDIKIKAGIRHGTLTVVFVLAFFAAEQLGQALISDRAGPWFGLAGAGILAVAVEPLRRFADKVANRAMPQATGSPEYVAQRRASVYRAALEGAYEDGEVTSKERAMLTRLAAELEIEPREMVALEDEVKTARGAAAAAQPSASLTSDEASG